MTTFRCKMCNRDLEIQFTMGNKPYARCDFCNVTWNVPPKTQGEIIKQPDGSYVRECKCGCPQLHPYDPERSGRDYDPNADWVKMLDVHARNFIDMPLMKDFNTEPLAVKDASPVKVGIFVKMGPGLQGLKYLDGLMKSVMISDVQQPMVVWIHGWGTQTVGGDGAMGDIYMGRDQGVPMIAQHVVDDGIVAMIDNDIVLPPRWYSHIREVFDRDPTIGAIYPMIQLEGDTAIQLVQVPRSMAPPVTGGGVGPNDIHNYNPDLKTYIHKGRGQIFLDDAKLMGTLAWRCTDMAVFYRAKMVKDGLQYTHDWSRWKLTKGFKTVLDKDFVVAHYKEFGDRNYGYPNKQLPFYACERCNHICGWGEERIDFTLPSSPLAQLTTAKNPPLGFCPTCGKESRKIE